ncbi:hypothetical protein PINS_up003646 [Pythium insidiosum]|nr:hypothetical protein PINS_up003646 [Pythium insidiosum]
MSVNAAFSIAFNPNAQLFRNLRDATSPPVRRVDSESDDNASSSDGSVTLRDIDDELVDQVRELTAANEALERETQETYELLDQMQCHIESLEEHQHALVAYVNKLCNDVKNVKRRGVWQKIEYDKERQQLVEELYSWKRQAEELKAREQDALSAAEANAAWEAACLNQTIEQLQGEVLTLRTELETAQEELSRRAAVAKVSEEHEQMLEALKELVVELKTQVDTLEQHKVKSNEEVRQLRDLLSDAKQKIIKDGLAHDRERQELEEEVMLWRNRALQNGWTSDTSAASAAPVQTVAADHSVKDAALTVADLAAPSDEENQEEHEEEDDTLVDDALEVKEDEDDNQKMDVSELTASSSPDAVTDPSTTSPDEMERISSSSTDTLESESVTEVVPSPGAPLEPPLGLSVKTIADIGNQTSAQGVADAEEKPLTLSSSACSQQDDDNQEETLSPPVSSKSAMSSVMDDEATDDERDSMCESPLVTPRHSDSFFDRLSFFSFRSRSDSMSSQSSRPESTTPSHRSRTQSTASMKSVSSSSKASSRASLPSAPRPQREFFNQQPSRLNSFKHFM